MKKQTTMKKQTIKEIKKRIDYVWKNPSPKVKSERVTQLYNCDGL